MKWLVIGFILKSQTSQWVLTITHTDFRPMNFQVLKTTRSPHNNVGQMFFYSTFLVGLLWETRWGDGFLLSEAHNLPGDFYIWRPSQIGDKGASSVRETASNWHDYHFVKLVSQYISYNATSGNFYSPKQFQVNSSLTDITFPNEPTWHPDKDHFNQITHPG